MKKNAAIFCLCLLGFCWTKAGAQGISESGQKDVSARQGGVPLPGTNGAQGLLDVSGVSLSVLYDFTNYSGPTGLVRGPDGALYGTMAFGGPFVARDQQDFSNNGYGFGIGYGSVFKITPAGQFSTLYSFGSVSLTSVLTNFTLDCSNVVAPGATNFGDATNISILTNITGGITNIVYVTNVAAMTNITGGVTNFGYITNVDNDSNVYYVTNIGYFTNSPSCSNVYSLVNIGGISWYATNAGLVNDEIEYSDVIGGVTNIFDVTNFYYMTNVGGGITNFADVTNVSEYTNISEAVTNLVCLTNFYYSTNIYPLNGAYPTALTLGSDGVLYGNTEFGGLSYSNGTIFKMTTNGDLTTLYNFGFSSDHFASAPAAALVEGLDGRLYGTTESGGDFGGGVVFAIATNGAFSLLNSFPEATGCATPLIQGSDGNLYGTANTGGIMATNHEGTNVIYMPGYGAVFKVNPSSGQITNLHTFGSVQDTNGDPLDGAVPGGLVEGGDGNLYGATEYGGANDDYNIGGNGDGTLFRISPTNAGSFTTLLSFDENSTDGYNPIGSLVPGANGTFYGIASAGGTNRQGAVFVYNPTAATTNIVWLSGDSGDYGGDLGIFVSNQSRIFGESSFGPVPSLLALGQDGNLYGVTTDGGTNGAGTVYELTAPAATAAIEVLEGAAAIVNNQTNAVNLGSVLEGSPGPVATFTVENVGGAALTISTPIVTGGFTLVTNPPATIGAGGEGTFSVLLDSITLGVHAGSISFATSDPGNGVFSIPLAGQVVSNYSLTAGASPANGGTVNGGGSFAPGSQRTLTATPASGFEFVGWTGDGSGGNASLAVTVNANLSITAYFAPIQKGFSLTIVTNGEGKVSPNPTGKLLTAPRAYTLTATASNRNVFSGWTGSFTTNKDPYLIKVSTNLVLQANFAANPFLAMAGTYNGLFMAGNSFANVTESNAGMVKGLTVNQKGAYSGSLLIDGASHALSGTFSLGLQATNIIKRPASQGNLVVEMALASGGSAPQVTGTVSVTNAGAQWEAVLTAALATNALPSAAYTLLIPPNTNDSNTRPPSGSPGGDGYALITNYAGTAKNPSSAKATLTGALADGTAFSQSVPVSQAGFVPIYANLYSGKGLLLGWINLDLTNVDALGVSGLTWIHPERNSGSYKNGFTNVVATNQIQISEWSNAPFGEAVFRSLTNLSLMGSVTDTNALTNFAMTIGDSGQLGGSVTGSINPKTGLLKVTFGKGASKTTGYGAVLLNANLAGGYYLTKTNTAQALKIAP